MPLISKRLLGFTVVAMFAACGAQTPASPCGPASALVAAVTDGDTIVLEGGQKIRYLLVDTPEVSGGEECYGPEARELNRSLVLGKTIELRYDDKCTDRFDRTLAYVSVDGREVNRLLVERGFGCVLVLPPAGASRAEEFESVAASAKAEGRGLWGFCSPSPCSN